MNDWLFVEDTGGYNSVKWIELHQTATAVVTSIIVNTQPQGSPSQKMFYRLTDTYF